MKTQLIFKLSLVLLISSFCVFAESDDDIAKKQKLIKITNSSFSNLLAQANEKYAAVMNEQEKLIWTLSNLWLSVDETADVLDCANDEVIYFLSIFENSTLANYYKSQINKINNSDFHPDEHLTKLAKKFRAELKNMQKSGTRKRRFLKDNGSQTIAKRLKQVENEINKQKKQFDKLKNKQLKELQKQMSSAQKQIKSFEKAGKNFKVPKVPKVPRR